jgi:type II secretory pathway predicted ATPase ExeA
LALVLSGQTELWDKLRLQNFAAIRQRIDIQCNTTHLDESQSAAYIKTHLSYAGYDKPIFTDAAIDDIFKFTGGTMRFINKVCTASLMYGAQNHKTVIDDHMVKLIINNEFS